MKIGKILNILLFFQLGGNACFAQEIPMHQVVEIEELSRFLDKDVRAGLQQNGSVPVNVLAAYFREKFSERFYYDWKTFESRFEIYKNLYPEQEQQHKENALDHMGKYKAGTTWALPFNYKNGEPVDAYALRHLARQHKMVDIAFLYYYSDKDGKYLNYFTQQMASLNKALETGKYEKLDSGNGVYEKFRSGYRILNWLWIHNMFLSSEEYSDEEQLITIATLLQHGAHLYEENPEFTPGNHQTRGMSALAMLSILLRDFEETRKWYQHSMNLLQLHLTEEINSDGFQFERSVHYHISDIGNYYNVFRLAQKSGLEISDGWKESMYALFGTLARIAYPDGSAPVLQDDTDVPWAEKNYISKTMSLGYLLFEDPELGFFADEKVEAKMYWFIGASQLKMLHEIKRAQPEYNSLSFPVTGYYVMREGWNPSDKMMIITAGLDDKKPDHQHGDMLGVQAMANGRVVLPNYQVRYYLKDLEIFKNSLVKNVALVDEELQGKGYTSNQGGSGFGKFRKLPVPKTIAWEEGEELDVFIGSHDGFEDIGVNYVRQVFYVKDDFWIVKDNFKSVAPHTYKQVWQGHYSKEHAPGLLRSSFDNGSGMDILQLREVDTIESSGQRGKQWTLALKNGEKEFSFITLLFPFGEFDKRINELDPTAPYAGWERKSSEWKVEGSEPMTLFREDQALLFSITKVVKDGVTLEFEGPSDVYLNLNKGELRIQSLDPAMVELKLTGGICGGSGAPIKLLPGKTFKCDAPEAR